ncbi:MFS transporter [Streptomyces katsurahamanus]|uniref:MFS transporter n=1 Tax=Streptomyces katsurahamanus TaxID=2577098 RepID=A0ABW9P1S4_9ACTN|nr:MFS transporter [Streptomyces katsurahamanus]MQS39445.1 MFS transporter [Streptomyces katsurahamanus]
MSSTVPKVAPPKAGAREWAGLAVLALPTLLLALDQSVLFLALPHLAESLNPTGTQTLWIMDVYGFLSAGFLVTMGTLGDRIGRRKLLMIGASVVGVASLLAAFSTSAEMLIVTRALLGVAAATLMPSTLALISNMFQDARQRGRAIAVWASCFMGGTALGPVAGGVLLEYWWWGSVFLLGVPVMLILLVSAPFVLPEYRDPNGGRIDLTSVALSLAAILPVIYGLKEIAREGWEPARALAIVAGLVFGALFARRQRTLEHPLMDLSLFKRGAFTASLLILMFAMATMGGSYLFITGYLQMVEGLSPVEAGLWMVPSAVASIVAATLAPTLVKRLPMGVVIGGGLGVTTIGYLLLAFVDPVGGLPLLVAGFVIAFLGTGPIGALGTNLVVSSAPPEKGGSAASVSETSGQFGVAFGLAALGSLGGALYQSRIAVPDGLSGDAADTVRAGIEGAVAEADKLQGALGDQVLTAAREAYTSGLNTVAVVCAALAAVTAVLATTALRKVGGDGGAHGAHGAPEGGEEAAPEGTLQPTQGR